MLKAIVASLDEVPEAARTLYTKTGDGKYKLEIEGMVDKAKLDEFRENNVALNKKLEDLSKQMESFKGVDPTKFKEYEEQARQINEKELIKKGDFETLVAQRTAAMKKDLEDKIAAQAETIKNLESEKTKAYGERDSYIVESELRKAAEHPEAGYNPGVADILLPHVMKEFTIKDGKVTRVKPDGTVVYGKDSNPATIQEFLQDMSKDRPWMLKPSSGSGAPGNNGKGAANGKTMKRADYNALDPMAQHAFAVAGKGTIVD